MSKADETKHPAGTDSIDPANETAGVDRSPADDIATLAAAVEELRDKFLRAVAETDNVRKRAERDVADARAYGIANFAREIIGVADNLARALEAIEPEARVAAQGTLKALLDGVELTRRELEKALAKQGVRPLDPKGEKFDPHLHQAMYEVPQTDVPPGTVVQVMQTGYAIGDRVLRPALVAVAKGGAKGAGQVEGADSGENPAGS
jgi:molecular chaperone GrpE